MVTLKPVKAGDTISFKYFLPLVFGSAIASIRSQLRTEKFNLVDEFTIVQLPDTTEESVWQLTASAEQSINWPVRQLYCDIRHLAVDGTVIHTDTFIIPVDKAQTI